MILNNQPKIDFVKVIGAGLAGSEAALYLANNGVKVKLYEMKLLKKTPAQTMMAFGELVCSNSLKSLDDQTASGLLKKELEMLDCSLLKLAHQARVPAGSALAVDRDIFARQITDALQNHPNIEVISEIVEDIDTTIPTILATGPLTEEKLFANLQKLIGEQNCYFYDAIAPIVSADSLDEKHTFVANRYNKGEGEGDYINCFFTKEEYDLFYNELINAKRAELKDFEKVFEGCMPVEVLAKRGYDALRFGPMKPVGLFDERRNQKPFAVLQLRKENTDGSLLNLVGFQTNLTYGEQKRVFSLIPALKNANFVRFGQMHRNSYINAPEILNEFSALKKFENIFIAGQLSGVEGYMESIASGLYCAVQMLAHLKGEKQISLSEKTVLGAMIKYISSVSTNSFQPVNSNFGIVFYDGEYIRDKKQKRQVMKELSLQEIKKFKERKNGN